MRGQIKTKIQEFLHEWTVIGIEKDKLKKVKWR